MVTTRAKSAGTVAIGTVKGDLHDIGKNLVCSMLEGAGFEIIDLGVDVARRTVSTVADELHHKAAPQVLIIDRSSGEEIIPAPGQEEITPIPGKENDTADLPFRQEKYFETEFQQPIR